MITEQYFGPFPDRFAQRNRRRDVTNFPRVIDEALVRLHPIAREGKLKRESHDGFDVHYSRDLRAPFTPSVLVTENGYGDFAEYGMSHISFMFNLDGPLSIKRTILTHEPKVYGKNKLCSRQLSTDEMDNLLMFMIIPEIHSLDRLPKGLIDLNSGELAIVQSKKLFVSEMVLKASQPIRE